MEELNSSYEYDQLFAETNTLLTFYELEQRWNEARHKHNHPFLRYLHKITDEEYINDKFNRHH